MLPLVLLALPLIALAALALFAQGFRLWVERRHPPLGRMVDADGTALHVVECGDPDDPEPLVFLHGASGNLYDQLAAWGGAIPPGRGALFVDRPGHGHSRRGPAANATPRGQADALAALLDALGVECATIVGHSYGGAVASAFALHHPTQTRALVLVSPVTHPWPGGRTLWYYDLTARRPWLGRLLAYTVLVPAGLRRTPCAVAGVFSPQPVPAHYRDRAAIALALRPASFLANAADLTALHAALSEDAPRYGAIVAPTAIVAGERDRIVWTDIHARAMARAVPGARLVTVPDLGHKPDWIAPGLVWEAVAAAEGDLAGWRPCVPDVPVIAPPETIEPGIETGPEEAPTAVAGTAVGPMAIAS